MRNEQYYCDRCGKLLWDKKIGINEPRHSVLVVFGYSRSGTWGERADKASYESVDGLCDDCFKGWWELGNKVNDWLRKSQALHGIIE